MTTTEHTCACRRFHTDECLALDLGLTVEEVRTNCRPSVRGWPHMKLKRNVWRFTDAQVEQIAAMQSARRADSPAATGGQTAASKARAS